MENADVGENVVMPRDAVRALAQVSMLAHRQKAGPRTSLRFSDVKVREFSGYRDPAAHHIETDQSLPLLR